MADNSAPIERAAQRLAAHRAGEVVGLEATLASLLREARGAWPEIDLSDEAFFDQLIRNLTEDADPKAELSRVQATDLFLAAACASHHKKALAAFERLHMNSVPRALARLRPSSDLVEEVKQALREKLLMPNGDRPPRIADYSGRGPLGAWVRVAALRTALSLRRKRGIEPSPEASPDVAAATPGPEVRVLRARYRSHLKSAIEQAIASVEASDRALLRQHLIEGLTVEQLGAKRGVHGSTISRRLAAVRKAVLDETRRLLTAQANVKKSELTSLIRAVYSELDVSLVRVLGGEADEA